MKPTILELLMLTGMNPAAPLPNQLAPLTEEPVAVVKEVNEEPKTEKSVKYTVKKGDTLTEIGEKHDSSWLRLWQKNTSLKNPDRIKVGQKITIPRPEERLKHRPLPTIPVEKPSSRGHENGTSTSVSKPKTSGWGGVKAVPRGSSAGNLYTYGYCTWYVKNRRPDLPNNLGNAITWTVRARNQDIATGTRPVPGAVGQKGNHVVYVESVNGSRMTISEMNYKGWNIRSSRTTTWAGWNFIY